ncbi:Hypothetical predicted protein [Olea europaea subsp. europaea]|uniref:Uncharacterized protein n=1 Tax=Olea europaea subsp. europaea TaxID=158383 RepID=A0A8S0RQX7_OLEEU|nr:Hypothetical predicted protein [Olea europaea subsp. europaea]
MENGMSCKGPGHSPHFVSGLNRGLLHQFGPCFEFYNSTEGSTKWDPVGWKILDALKQVIGRPILNQRTNAAPLISVLDVVLELSLTKYLTRLDPKLTNLSNGKGCFSFWCNRECYWCENSSRWGCKDGESSLIVTAAAENFPINVHPIQSFTKPSEDIYLDHIPRRHY